MSWADAIPNLLIGLREGLEAGLVVSILLAALRKTAPDDRQVSSAPIWLGVLGAVSLAGSFAAVLTYSTSVLSSQAQEAVGGILSVVAVGLVTGMVFWMRRTAVNLSSHLRGEVSRAAKVGAGALALTAFVSVGREGLETTLFIWTAVKASGQTASPLIGAGLGLAAAIVLCALLYRRAVKLNLGVFFTRTAIALIVIAAGVLAYGLGDLQDAGLLPGQQWLAFDLTHHIDPTAWWVSIITGVTELAPKMTVLQVGFYLAYLVAVVPAFVKAGGQAPAPAAAVPANAVPAVAAGPSRWERLVGQRLWITAGALVAIPAAAAGATIVAIPSAAAASTTSITVTSKTCASEWSTGHTGTQTFEVDNKSSNAGEINLDDTSGAIVAEIETLGPATTATMSATLSPGSYTFRCLLAGKPATASQVVQVTGKAAGVGTAAVAPATVAELTGPNDQYQAYAAGVLQTLQVDVAKLRADLVTGDVPSAETDWLAAQLDWEQVGASYDSFGDDGTAVDGLPDGLPLQAADPGFTGLHRIEYGLWHGQAPTSLVPVADQLTAEITTVQKNLTSDDLAGDPTNLPIRAHEILEDALRDHLSGIDDEGAGAAYPMTMADVDVDRTVLGELAPLITARRAGLLPTVQAQLDTLQAALQATQTPTGWLSPTTASEAQRDAVNGALGALLENLSAIPDLLEVPPNA